MMEGTRYQLRCTRDMHKGGTEIGQSETRVITTASQVFLKKVFVQNFIPRWPISAVKKKKKKAKRYFIISPDTL